MVFRPWGHRGEKTILGAKAPDYRPWIFHGNEWCGAKAPAYNRVTPWMNQSPCSMVFRPWIFHGNEWRGAKAPAYNRITPWMNQSPCSMVFRP
ncbi:hypothetical protein Q4574_21315, partial [Aliiglaciecola sp. 3_MG-2023]|uniref:hypothetical protein n=1 Tax=Aliiglaciecola sp. 3_MG-2023 TaxID=3062644 RepID=UPI0026E365D3